MPASKAPNEPHLKKEPAKLRKPVNGHILLEGRGHHCLYFTELPPMSHSLCCGGGMWPACPDFNTCCQRSRRAPRDTTWLEEFSRRSGV